MISFEDFKKLATSFPEVTVEPHFEKTSFRVKNKIFATFDPVNYVANVKLSPEDQDVFSTCVNGGIKPVSNKWGRQGWTQIDLKKVDPGMGEDAITTAYCEVAPEKLASKVRGEEG